MFSRIVHYNYNVNITVRTSKMLFNLVSHICEKFNLRTDLPIAHVLIVTLVTVKDIFTLQIEINESG